MRNLIIFLLLSPLTLISQNILGPSTACIDNCEVYTFQSTSSGPFIWNVTGVDFNSNVGTSLEICWSEAGSQTIAVTDVSATPGSHLTTLSVNVTTPLNAELVFPYYPSCETRDSVNGTTGGNEDMEPSLVCKSVCGGSTVEYPLTDPLSTHIWDIEGAANIENGADKVTITWNPAGAGYINIVKTDSNSCTIENSYCIDILEVPTASAILSTNNICLGQTVTLNSNTTNVVDYFWSSGDGQTAHGSQAQFTYNTAGSFTGNLVVQTECFCYDTTSFIVNVDINPGPRIECLGTVCSQDTATYFAADLCSQYNWAITGNGSITDGGGSGDGFVEVVWTSGPFGEVSLATPGCGASCATATTEVIPIIMNTVNIEGPQTVCKGVQSTYRAPRFGGTQYSWSVNGPGTIISGFGTEEIVVQWEDLWDTPSTAEILLEYNSCFLECSGSAVLNVDLKDPFEITGLNYICIGQASYITASHKWNAINADWKITGPDGSVQYTAAAESTVNYPFDAGPGVYKIVATVDPTIACNPILEVYVPVDPLPEITVDVIGDMIVCLGEDSEYTLPINELQYNVTWRIVDGGSTSNLVGKSINYTWTSFGPYSIFVSIRDLNIYCSSEEIEVVPTPAMSSTITGNNIACLDSRDIYYVNGLTNTPTDWQVTPSDAGSLRQLPDGSLEIHWHESGTHTISAGFCATSIVHTVEVLAKSMPIIAAPDGVCVGDLATVNITIPSGATIAVKDESLSTISTSTTLDLDPGFYLIEMTDINGCLSQETFEMEEYIIPDVRISTSDNTGFCPGAGESGPTLYALNTLSGYTYEWFRDGVSLGVTTNSMSSSIFGYYHVVATNTYGCTVTSNVIRVFEYCGPNGRCNGNSVNLPPCQDGTYVSFTAANTGFCNEFSFTNTSTDFIPGTILYHFDDPDAGVDSISILENPDHTFTFAGHYLVTMLAGVTASVNPPECWDYVDIVVPVAANFTASEGCANEGISFTQEVTFVTGYSVANYSWDFGDPASGVNNSSTDAYPMHTYSSGGTYNVNLTVTSNTGCQSRISKEVIVQDSPNVDFNLPVIQCQDTAIPFDALVSSDAIDVNWDFGDAASGAANESNHRNALHTFSNSQIYNVSLSASNIYGCTNTISKSIDISNSLLAGDILQLPSGTICVGDSVELTAPSGGLTYLWSNGSVGTTIKVGDNKKYTVTITDPGGCQFIPDPARVEYYDVPEFKISAIVEQENFQSETYIDYVELCDGTSFYLRTQSKSGLQYLWTVNNHTSFVLSYWNGLRDLLPGTHSIAVTVTDPNTGCVYEVDPITVVIHPRPNSPTVVSDQATNCEGELHTLTITNYNSDYKYYWSNGQEGPSIITAQSGNYQVQVISDEGCEGYKGGFTIHPRPEKDVFPDGCQEVCFPKTVCVPTNLGYTYEWLKDGVPMSNNATSIELTEPGDYQVVMTHYSGCSETSDILSIEPKSGDHKLAGTVFLDVNENGIYDAGDQLLENAVVQLMDGATVVETILSDINGYYSFEQLDVTSPTIVVDVSSLGFNIPSPTQSEDFVFTECVEEQIKDFPFTDQCIRQSLMLDLNTCTGQPLIYETLTLMPGETDSIVYVSASGCDSTVIINAIESVQATVIMDINPACDPSIGGSIILSSDLPGTTYSLDNPSSFSESFTYDNLTPGAHDLWVLDPNGCPQIIAFTVDMIVEPLLDISTTSTCSNASDGTANITVLDGQSYDYSLDGTSFGTFSTISQLSAGNHMLYVTSTQGCIWELPFVVDQYIEPMVNISPTASCTTMNNGTVSITNLSSGTFTYELDNNGASTTNTFENLAPGNHTINVLDVNGCSYIYGFTINEEELPMVNLTSQNVCEGQNNGSLSLTQMGVGTYSYSIDATNYQTDPEFTGLPEGNYTVYIENINGCSTSENFAIATAPTPMVVIQTDEACAGIDNGGAQFASTANDLEFSLDGLLFSTTPNVQNLEAGTYTLYVQAIDGCIHTYPFEILEAAVLDVTFIEPVIDCSMTSVMLEPEVITAAGNATFMWSDGSTESSMLIHTAGNYSIEVMDNCSVSYYEWNIDFIETEIGNFYAPNIFSPNGDGVNDEFRPVYKDPLQISSYSLHIFDRWGSLVYQSTDLDQGWDGNFAANAGQSGVFVWMIRAEGNFCNNVEVFELVGDVTIVR